MFAFIGGSGEDVDAASVAQFQSLAQLFRRHGEVAGGDVSLLYSLQSLSQFLLVHGGNGFYLITLAGKTFYLAVAEEDMRVSANLLNAETCLKNIEAARLHH